MKKIKPILLFFALIFLHFVMQAQVTVSGATLQPFNVTPSTVCQAILVATGETSVTLEAKLFNSAGEVLLNVRTQSIQLHAGVNALQTSQIIPLSIVYGTSQQAVYVQSNKQLPSGMFRHCITVIGGGGEPQDEFCEELESSVNSFLNLVSPFDKDTLDSPTPVLTWTHSEPFSLLAPGETFRIVIAIKNADQDAEAAVIANVPLYTLNNVLRHDMQYPFDAPALKEEVVYAWQVQKMAAGGQGVIAKSEAWTFTLRSEKKTPDQKYAVMKKKPDAGYYLAANGKIFFRFDEAYAGSNLKCRILNEQNQEMKPETENEQKKEVGANSLNAKSTGYNRYELDLSSMNLKSGYYFLEVTNEKNDKYILKFYVE
jgi:hypothetical protein